MLPRRRFLKLATASPIAVSALAQTACSLFNSESTKIERTQFGNLLSFTTNEANTLFAFAEGCLALDQNTLFKAQVIPRLDEELYFVSSYIKEDFKLALSVMEYLPLVYGEFSRFSKLAVQQRTAFLDKLKNTDSTTVRAVIHNIRMTVMLSFYGHDSTWKSIQYDGAFTQIPPQISTQRQHYADITSPQSTSLQKASVSKDSSKI